jgi:hypothetical protein
MQHLPRFRLEFGFDLIGEGAFIQPIRRLRTGGSYDSYRETAIQSLLAEGIGKGAFNSLLTDTTGDKEAIWLTDSTEDVNVQVSTSWSEDFIRRENLIN